MILKLRRMNAPSAPLLTAFSIGMVASALLALLVLPSTGPGDRANLYAITGTPSPGQSTLMQPTGGPNGTASASPIHVPGSTGGGPQDTTGGPPPTTGPTPTKGPQLPPLLIGVPVPDLSVVRNLGPSYDLGPVEQQFQAAAAAYHRRHQLPAGGRDIKFVFATYNILDDSDQRRACTQLVDDDHVFAVVSIFLFPSGAQCTGGEKHVPTISGDPYSQVQLSAAAPYLFSVSAELGRALRHSVDWMIGNGLVKGHRIGLYYNSVPDTSAQLVRDNFIATLKARGYQLAAEVTTRDGSTGGPTDAVAVQRFQSAHVDVAVLLVSPLAKSNFLSTAQQQGYKPTEVTNDFAIDTSTAAASPYPAGAFDGAWGMTSFRSGEIEAGIMAPRAASCLADYKAATGRPRPDPHTGELASVLSVCDAMDVLVAGMAKAPTPMTQKTLITGLQGVGPLSLAGSSRLEYAPGKYDGLDQVRTIRWHADCTCWKAVGPFQELPR
jgi:ABC-type branched-subunit amino acid transport system substrate-binding protein